LIFLFAIIPHQIIDWSTTARTGAMFWDITFHTTKYRLDGFIISHFIVRDQVFPIPFLMIENDFWKLINLELLVLGRMGIIESPLLEWDVSTDKVH